ncbi:MAG: VWA domain-containing protein [Spirochaetales bacterium]|nr:VWA domain-containing protein [Spirochaetales bacterium]
MTVALSNPRVLLLLALLIPVVSFVLFRLYKLRSAISSFVPDPVHERRLYRSLLARTFFFSLAWILTVIALSGPQWGFEQVATRGEGVALSLVMDVSRSMTIEDMDGDRLYFSATYARNLLASLPSLPVSVVIVKGSAHLAIPLTEDRRSVLSLLSILSPDLVTTSGSNIGAGITAALDSFPPLLESRKVILLCTDGGETRKSLLDACSRVRQEGVTLIILGVASSQGGDISVSGSDGVYTHRSVLEESFLQEAVSRCGGDSLFIRGDESGSADVVRRAIMEGSRSSEGMLWQTRPIRRSWLFATLAVICVVLGCIVSGLAGRQLSSVFLASATFLFFSGCSFGVSERLAIAQGFFKWTGSDMSGATAAFLPLASQESPFPSVVRDYANYGLAATYLGQGEYEAALNRLSLVSADASDVLKAGALYQAGIISYLREDYASAQQLFRSSLEVDPTSYDAKINLELSIQKNRNSSRVSSGALPGVTEDQIPSDEQEAIFDLLRKKEQDRWKNRPVGEDVSVQADH